MDQAPQGQKSNSNKIIIIIVVVILVLGLLSWVASMVICGLLSFGAKKMIEAGTGVQYNTTTNGVNFKVPGANGETVEVSTGGVGQGGAVVSLPKSFPSTFPIPAGARPTSGAASSNAEGNFFQASWETSQPLDTVVEFYKTAMATQQWVLSSETSVSTNSSILIFARPVAGKENTTDAADFSITSEGGMTSIGLGMSINK